MTKAQHLKDEQVLAAIIAGAKGDGRPVRRGDWGIYREYDYDTGVDKVASGPVCAVGAGCLFAGLRMIDGVSATEEFAIAHGVSKEYACGVSDGFEGTAYENYDYYYPGKQEEYERGVAVGVAAGLALNPRGLLYCDYARQRE